MLVFTESWLSPDIPSEKVLIPNFSHPFRNDRVGGIGGGVIIYVRNTLTAKERPDILVNNLEAVWIELQCNRRKLLIGGIYRPPDANNCYWNLLEESN